MGAPLTGVPGLLPMWRGEFIMPPAGEDMGSEVAGEPGLGLAIAPGGAERGPDCGYGGGGPGMRPPGPQGPPIMPPLGPPIIPPFLVFSL